MRVADFLKIKNEIILKLLFSIIFFHTVWTNENQTRSRQFFK